MTEAAYAVKGMHCTSCAANISELVGEVAGVSKVDVDLEGETVMVRGEGFDDAAVREAIAAAGYQAA
jgi:copper chaperone